MQLRNINLCLLICDNNYSLLLLSNYSSCKLLELLISTNIFLLISCYIPFLSITWYACMCDYPR